MAAGDAVKRGLAALTLEAPVIATVVVKPQAEKDRRDEQAVDDDRSGQGEHGTMLAEISGHVFEIKPQPYRLDHGKDVVPSARMPGKRSAGFLAMKDHIELKERLFSVFFLSAEALAKEDVILRG
jgi:hypothetical protein